MIAIALTILKFAPAAILCALAVGQLVFNPDDEDDGDIF